MRLLFDQNLSWRLNRALADLYPQAVHVRDVGLASAADATVWDFARANGLTIVTKDAGDPVELAQQYVDLKWRLTRLKVMGGCCGTDHRHLEQIASASLPLFRVPTWPGADQPAASRHGRIRSCLRPHPSPKTDKGAVESVKKWLEQHGVKP